MRQFGQISNDHVITSSVPKNRRYMPLIAATELGFTLPSWLCVAVEGYPPNADCPRLLSTSRRRHRCAYFATGTNLTHTGLPTVTTDFVSLAIPVVRSISNVPILSASWLAINIHFPVGSMLKFRGVLMLPVMWPAAISLPSPPTLNTATLLCPRLET